MTYRIYARLGAMERIRFHGWTFRQKEAAERQLAKLKAHAKAHAPLLVGRPTLAYYIEATV